MGKLKYENAQLAIRGEARQAYLVKFQMPLLARPLAAASALCLGFR